MDARTRTDNRFGVLLMGAALAAVLMMFMFPRPAAHADPIVYVDPQGQTVEIPDYSSDTTHYVTPAGDDTGIPDPADLSKNAGTGNGTVDSIVSWSKDALKWGTKWIPGAGTTIDGLYSLVPGGSKDSGGGGLIGMAVSMVTNSINTWLYNGALVGMHWSLSLITKIMRVRILVNAEPGSKPVAGSLLTDGNLWATTFGSKVITMQGIAFALLSIFMVMAGIRIMATSFTGSGTYALRQLVPRAGMALFGIYGATWICQKILDMNYWMVSEILGSGKNDVYNTSPIQVFYKNLYNNGSSATATLILILAYVMVIALVILCILYWIRMAGIMVLVFLSPVVFSLYINEGTEYLTFTWLKVFTATVFIQFIHAAMLVMFASTIWSGADALESALLGLTLLYLMIKVPKWLLKSATMGGGGGARSAVHVATTTIKSAAAISG